MKLLFIWNLCLLTIVLLIVHTHAFHVNDYPIKCLFNNNSCAMHEYCDEEQGDCVSCFPSKYYTHESRFHFCLEFQFEAETKMLDPSCVGACDAMFGRKTFFEVAAMSTTTKLPSTTPTTQSTTTKDGLTYNRSSDDYILIFGTIITGIGVILIALVFVIIVWLKKLFDQSNAKTSSLVWASDPDLETISLMEDLERIIEEDTIGRGSRQDVEPDEDSLDGEIV